MRVITLAAEGRSFCAGAALGAPPPSEDEAADEPPRRRTRSEHLYVEGARLMEAETPVVAAIQGAAIGGGLGLALTADFRVAAPEARFAANFAGSASTTASVSLSPCRTSSGSSRRSTSS